jgi:hypothetical protein
VNRRLVLVVAGAALVVRIAVLLAVGTARTEYYDAREYGAIAKNLVEKRAFVDDDGSVARRPPLYPWLLALHGGSFAVARWTQALIGAALCVLAALLALRASEPAAWIAGLACAVHPLLAFTSVASLGEAAWMPLAVAEVLLLHDALERRSWKLALAAGAAGGLATLGHAGHLLSWAVLGVAALALWRGSWRTVGVYAAASLLLPGLWMARNAAVLGGYAPVTTKAGLDLYEAFAPDSTGGPNVAAVQRALEDAPPGELAQDRALRAKAFEAVAASPGRAVGLAVRKQARFWTPVPNFAEYRSAGIVLVSAAALVPTTLLLLGSLAWIRRWPKAVALAGVAVLYTALLHAVFIGSIRYRLTVEPFIVVIGAWAAVTARGVFGPRPSAP